MNGQIVWDKRNIKKSACNGEAGTSRDLPTSLVLSLVYNIDYVKLRLPPTGRW